MADILIRGMEMPKEEEISKFVIIRYDGEVWIGESDNLVDGGFVACYPTNPMRAAPLPAGHGRLIDGDAVTQEAYRSLLECEKYGNEFKKPYEVIRAIETAKTIVPAEGGCEE